MKISMFIACISLLFSCSDPNLKNESQQIQSEWNAAIAVDSITPDSIQSEKVYIDTV